MCHVRKYLTFALCSAYFSEKFESVEDENPYEGEMNIQYNLVGEQWLTAMVSHFFCFFYQCGLTQQDQELKAANRKESENRGGNPKIAAS
jgi:hypothetical protein